MKLINRYILRIHFAPFIFGTITVIFIFLMQYLMNFIDHLLGKGLDTWVIIEFIIYNLSWIVVLAVPMGVLFSTLMSFGSMSAAHEITIIKASGGSLLKMMIPIIVLGFILSIALFWFNDKILPETNFRVKTMTVDIQQKKPTFALESGQFSNQLEGYTIISRKVDTATGRLNGVTIYDMTQFQRRNIISADTGYLKFTDNFRNLVLDLKKGEVHQFNTNTVDNYRKVNFDKYQIIVPARGFAFEQTGKDIVSKDDRELSISEMQAIVDTAAANKKRFNNSADSLMKNMLNSYIFGYSIQANKLGEETTKDNPDYAEEQALKSKRFGQEIASSNDDKSSFSVLNRIISKTNIDKNIIDGQNRQASFYDDQIRKFEVEIYKKYAIPFACLIFVFVGCPLGIMTKGGNFGISAGLTLVFYVIYWICLIGGEKLADRGYLQPWLAMWLGNIIIGILGLLLTLRVNYETLDFLKISTLFNLFRKKTL